MTPSSCLSPNVDTPFSSLLLLPTILTTFSFNAVLQRLTYGSADESEVHYLSSYSFSRDDIHSSSHDRMGGVAHGDIDGSDESGSYGDEEIDWDDEGEESDGDVDDGSESELNLGREVLDDGRDFLARDDYGEERVISRFTVSSAHWSQTVCDCMEWSHCSCRPSPRTLRLTLSRRTLRPACILSIQTPVVMRWRNSDSLAVRIWTW